MIQINQINKGANMNQSQAVDYPEEINSSSFKYDEIKSVFEDFINDKQNKDFVENHKDDLHHEIFNLDYYIIGRHKAKIWLEDEVFNVIDIINDTGIAEVNAIYNPNCTADSDYTNNISDILASEAVFILSPNYSHFSYLDYLRENYSGYVFCEKPPTNIKEDLKKLYKIKSQRIYYNYNFRFSKIAEILKNKNKFNLGNLVYGNIISGKGIALKKSYKKNWRSDKNKCPKGVFEMLSVHWLDLINDIFKIIFF